MHGLMRRFFFYCSGGDVMNQEVVRQIFDYRDGGLYWKQNRGSNAKAGARVGRLLPTGYRAVQVSGRKYQEHRLIYLYHHGFLPVEIDHINRVKHDNRIENLRKCSHAANQVNTHDRPNAQGYRGVKVNQRGRYAARITIQGKEIRLGSFDTAEQAGEAYKQAAERLFGEFAQ